MKSRSTIPVRMNHRLSPILAGIAILSVWASAVPAANAYIRLESGDSKPNRRTIFQDLENVDLYRTTSGDKETTHTSYRKDQREARKQMLLDEIRRRGRTYQGKEVESSIESGGDEPRNKRTKPGTAYTPLEPLRVPEAATTKLLRIRGKLRETTIKEEACRGLSGSRLARCQYERQLEKGAGAPQMIEGQE